MIVKTTWSLSGYFDGDVAGQRYDDLEAGVEVCSTVSVRSGSAKD